MTIKLNSLSRWRPAGPDALVFEGVGARRVRLHVNSPGVTLAWLLDGDGGVRQFLARVDGYEVIEFYAEGTVRVGLEGADAWWMCAEVEPTHVEIIDPVIFTKIANRRHRNPELEEMMFRMQMNMERRLAQQAGEIEAAFERRRKEIDERPAETVKTDAPGAAANAGGGTVPAPEPGPSKPGEAPGGEDGGEQSGG